MLPPPCQTFSQVQPTEPHQSPPRMYGTVRTIRRDGNFYLEQNKSMLYCALGGAVFPAKKKNEKKHFCGRCGNRPPVSWATQAKPTKQDGLFFFTKKKKAGHPDDIKQGPSAADRMLLAPTQTITPSKKKVATSVSTQGISNAKGPSPTSESSNRAVSYRAGIGLQVTGSQPPTSWLRLHI